MNVTPGLSVSAPKALNICVRAGCNNPAVESKDWDKEYCSNECVATHCRYDTNNQSTHLLFNSTTRKKLR